MRTSIARCLALACVVVLFGVLADSALADAADPVPAAMTGAIVTNGDGTKTLTLNGGWAWTTHTSDCNNDKRAVGYAIDWNDATQAGNAVTANITTPPPPHMVTADVGAAAANARNPADNTVHPTPPIPPPSPPTFGGCGTYSAGLGYNTGTWGPITHTYAAGTTTFNVCVLIYDVHLKTNGGAPNMAKETTAGGTDHNPDNSLQDNKNTPLGQGCFLKSVPALTTTASAAVNIGGSISDTATIAGGSAPTGTITYKAYTNSDCTGLVFTTTKPVTGNGAYASASFTPAGPGLYYWVASYGGDANNSAITTACDEAAEHVLVKSMTPTINTVASPHAAFPNDLLSDTAFLSGASTSPAATGTITFRLYGPNDATCTTSPVATSTATVTGNGTYTSSGFAPGAVGTYRWVATYSGDANNVSAVTACVDVDETAVVSKRSPLLTTNASADVTLGAAVSDSAILSGATTTPVAGGSILFKLYGPADPTCSGTPAYTHTTTVSGNGTYGSGSFTPSAAGTYRWVATYSGDAFNAVAANVCDDPQEDVIVSLPDNTKPTCVLAGFSDSNRTIHVMVGDSGSGIASIVPVTTNATAVVPFFSTGATAPMDVTATKIDTGSTAFLKLTVTDVAGNVTVCDPVVPGLLKRALHRGVQRVAGLGAMQSRVTIRNGSRGLSRVVLTVNGTRFTVGLRPGATRRVNVFAAMRPGHNRITIRSYGRSHSAAALTIGM